MFITFEGIEGSGKSTQINALQKHLTERGHDVDVTREPGGTPIAEAIRDLLLDPDNRALSDQAELLLYIAARAQHVAERIQPSLDAGRVVLCDRFADSTIAYQGAARGIARAAIRQMNEFATHGLQPDVTFLLDLPAKDGLERATLGRPADRIEQESIAFHEAVRAEFLSLANSDRDRIVVLDATRDAKAVSADIVAEVERRMPAARETG